MKSRCKSFLIIIFIFQLFACSHSGYRSHPEFDIRRQHLNVIKLAPPNINIYQHSRKDTQKSDEWSTIVKDNITKLIIQNLNKKGYNTETIVIEEDIKEEMDNIAALYRIVAKSIFWHTYSKYNDFPEKVKNFEYSVGSVENILNKYEADALILVYGMDGFSTAERQARSEFLTFLTLPMIILNINPLRLPEIEEEISIAIVDSSGTILWYNRVAGRWLEDMRNSDSLKALVEEILIDFPGTSK